MVFNPPELTLNCRNTYLPRTITDFLTQLSTIANASDRFIKLDEFINRLEEEIRKIDVFKRELPLSILLINDVIITLKEELMKCKKSNIEPILEEFIPLKKNSDADEKDDDDAKKELDSKDKRNWLSSVQLWNPHGSPAPDSNHHQKPISYPETRKIARKDNRLAVDGNKGITSFKSFSPFCVANKDDKEEVPVEGLSLLTPGIKNSKEELGFRGLSYKTSCGRAISSSSTEDLSNFRTGSQASQTSRKQRRCWSPELHRRFVNALQQLGGSQVATPKQIRELMQVDGLTNDEVKSHLQKYRLHTRKAPVTNGETSADQSGLILGGLWTQNKQDESSPVGPLQLAGPTGGTSHTGGDSMGDEEDENSSHSWKSCVHAS